jgi:uncharacterized membrane protein YeaQ/YmgE (transglycosylase-associated protein family)
MSRSLPQLLFDTVVGLVAVIVVGFVANAVLDVVLPGDPFNDFLPLALGVVGAFALLTLWSRYRWRLFGESSPQ